MRMNSPIFRLGFCGYLFYLLLAVPSSYAATAILSCPSEEPDPSVLLGIKAIESILTEQDWDVIQRFGSESQSIPPYELEIVVAVFAIEKFKDTPQVDILRDVVSNQPESMSVSLYPRGHASRIYAIGPDPIGTMYAAFDVAEQFESTSIDQPLHERIQQKKITPSLSVRGLKVVLHRQALEGSLTWFHSSDYWRQFLDRLARARFNYLELHGIYDLVTTEYFNLFPYLIPLSDYSQVGVNPEEAETNLNRLNHIIRLAHERGINVGLINHNTDWNLPDNPTQPEDINQKLDYNTKAFEKLLTECPTLDGYGHAIGENPNSTRFYEKSFLSRMQEKERPIILFLPSHLANEEQFLQIMEDYNGISVAQVKFNGDHLPLPYPVSGGPMRQWASYSYQNYFQKPRPYNIIFDISASGTHRLFPWADVEFIRKTIQNTSFAEANGFVVDTPSTYYPKTDEYTTTLKDDLRYFEWTFQRDWYWYPLWGRLGYNPKEPEETFIALFKNHFDEAGTSIYRALQKCSPIIPTITSIYALGVDKKSFAPEFEIPPSFTKFLQIQPFDPHLIRSVTEEAHILTSGRENGKLSPYEQIDQVVQRAENILPEMQQAGETLSSNLDSQNSNSNPTPFQRYREWKAMHADLQALVALGKCYRGLINASLHLSLYRLTEDITTIILASESITKAQESWNQFVEHTNTRYRPLLEPLRLQSKSFHWRNYTPPFENDQLNLAEIYTQWNERTEIPQALNHFRVYRTPPHQPILLTLCIPPQISVDALQLSFRNSVGSAGKIDMEPTKIEGVYYAEIPQRLVTEGLMEYYFMGEINQRSFTLPSEEEEATTYKVAVTHDTNPPLLVSLDHTMNELRNNVQIEAQFEDDSEVSQAHLHWKPLPSDRAWQSKPMKLSGASFKADFPLSPQGALYCVEAIDNYGNATYHPNLKENNMPFRVIKPSTP